MKFYEKPGLIIQKREHTLGLAVLCVKMINWLLQGMLVNHGHVGLIYTSEIWSGDIFREIGITNNTQ